MLELYARLARPGETRAAQAELRALLDGWRAREFGFGEGVEPDTALASVTALAPLAREPERTEELLGLLELVELALHEATQPEPDLALALARGWLALAALPRAGELTAAEVAERLGLALRASAAIDARDQRDAIGCQLARELYPRLRAAGRTDEASASLALALELFPDDLDSRPLLLGLLTDERRVAADWSAWTSLQQAEQALARLRARAPELPHADLERLLAGVRCQLELACGLYDRAVLSLQRERAAVAAGAEDAESKTDLSLNVAGVALACAQPGLVSEAMLELDEALATSAPASTPPGLRAAVRARRALLQDMWEELTPMPEPRAPAMLAAALADPALDEGHRTTLALKRVQGALRGNDLALAARLLAELEPEAQAAPRAPELTATLLADRALLALARGAEHEELQRHFDEVERVYERFLAAWRASPQREGGFGFHAWRSRRLLAGVLIELCLALDGPAGAARALELMLPEQALGSLARRLACAPGSLAEVRTTLLQPGLGLLVYLPGWRSTHLFVIDAQELVAFELPWRYEFEALPRELSARLGASPARLSARTRAAERKELEASAAELGKALLPPEVQQRLAGWRGVYVVGAELLGDIPFECLAVGAEAKELLGTRLAIAYLPSLSVGLELARRAAAEPVPRAGELLLVAAPENAAFAPIVLGKSEQAALSAGFEHTRMLTGRDASRDALLQRLKADPPTVLHFLVHGENDPEREFSGALALAPGAADPDGLLWGDEILSADFRGPPLVLLSACGSARGPRRAGDDGLAQLGGAFLSRGTRCTVQSTEDIALAPTLRLMACFTRELAAGASPAEAMLAARRELGREPEFAHPFYALSMRVIGLGFESARAR